MASDITQSSLNLTSEEKRAYGQLFQQADNDKLGVVTGDVAVKFFERTKLEATILAEIWQIADTENRGLLTPAGFSVALRLIGHCQAGRQPSSELSMQPGPLPVFSGPGPSIQTQSAPDSPQPIAPQTSGPVRVPPLTPDKVSEYSGLFEKAGARNGFLGGEAAKQMFERARLPNEALGQIWNLSDTEQRGALNLTEFIIAMHLIASMKTGSLRTLPQTLPAGLFEAASRRAALPQGQSPSVSRQVTGQMPQRTQSPLSRGAFGPQALSPQSTGDVWLVNPQDKAKFDQIFQSVDKTRSGHINGEQAVQFFSTSGLSEDTLATIWDLADINSEGQLNRDEFAVAMYLIRQQRSKRDDRGNLPTTLPPSLVPPSMRQRTVAPSQPTAPAFDNAAFAPQQPKSAADDLFGLDAMSSNEQASREVPSPPTSPQRAQTLQSPAQGQNTTFKPFIPTSSFGQGLATQNTGGSTQSSQAQIRGFSQSQTSNGGDDLLGDNDGEANSKITDETMELGNMSNQIGQLRTQMQEVQSKKTTTEGQLTNTSNQKRELETRLSQFRAQYEQEVREVKSLEETLNTSRSETRKLQQEMAMLEGAYQDLQTQHQQVATALEADQRENASLKERIQQMNAEVTQLRPQLDKMRSDARQQKGLVAINKKQLSTSEGERDKLQNEKGDLERETAESTASIQAEQQQTNSSVASPALSTASQSTNPFFRRSPDPAAERSMSPSVFTQTQGNSNSQNAFDNFFGTSEAAAQPSAPPPATSFRSATPTNAVGTPPIFSPSTPNIESPQPSEPPAPPESKQITSSSLPLRALGGIRSESFSSSVKANAPASRAGESASATPTNFASTPAESLDGDSAPAQVQAAETEVQDKNTTVEPSIPSEVESGDRSLSGGEIITPAVQEDTIPGAFPADTPVSETVPSAFPEPEHGSSRSLGTNSEAATNFGVVEPPSTNSGTELFPQSSSMASAESSKPTTEFPPIQSFEPDDESSSDGEAGFDDDFASSSAAPIAATSAVATSNEHSSTEAVTAADSLPISQPGDRGIETDDSDLPTPTAQISPPSYDQSEPVEGQSRDSNQFPPEFGGLLPSREITHSPPTEVPQSRPDGLTSSMQDAAPVNGTRTTEQVPPTTKPPAVDDEFDSAFDDLDEAKPDEEEGAGQDSFAFESNNRENYEYNPMFESPAPSHTTTGLTDRLPAPSTPNAAGTSSTRAIDSFSNFEPVSTPSKAVQGTSTDSSSHDWDAIFSGLDNNSATQGQENDPFSLSAPSAAAQTTQKPALTRAISTGTEHDDPILKTLTSMGYGRDDAVRALEKFDYNLDMAADYLTSRT